MYVTFGPFASFKLHFCVYGVIREDKDMNKLNPNTAGFGFHKLNNLLKLLFTNGMGLGHIATM